ncbi:MAG: SAM-dependent methyltransferase [Chthoniobacterales bacterium]|nr:SAM-dependent methyltransferase [Chthoniobacterales bacterium]
MCGKSRGLEAILRARLGAHGTIPFDYFMAAALYDTEHGYYATGEARTGRRGDFFTSVSVGPVFGRLLAAQFAEMRDILGCPDEFTLVEQGANDGQLMADILTALERTHPEWQGQAIIVEPLDRLRAAQQQTLAPWRERVRWVAHEAELPRFCGVFFANELIDAFPVKLFVHHDGVWFEKCVADGPDGFVFVEVPGGDAAAAAGLNSPPLAEEGERFETEWRPTLREWMQGVAEKLMRGWVLLADYGHVERERFRVGRTHGTLAAYRAHARGEDPLAHPGAQDLTAHVDFTELARLAEEAGLSLAGFTDQHHALTALAARVFPAMREAKLSAEEEREMRALRQLLHPETMGRAFKFIAFSRGSDNKPVAFEFARDARQELFS